MKILIWGAGESFIKISHLIRNKTKIVGFIDSRKENKGTWAGVPIYQPSEIKKIQHDMVLLASSFRDQAYKEIEKEGIDKEKIIDPFYFEKSLPIQSIHKQLTRKKFDSIITGLSYAYNGISEKTLNGNFANLSYPGQDILHDYKLAKKVIHQKKIRNAIIVISKYSFHYELSKSRSKSRVFYYEMLLNDSYENYLKEFETKHAEQREKAQKILRYGLIEKMQDARQLYKITKLNRTDGEALAKIDCNKNYPETVKFNTETLGKYLKLLNENNVNPIVVVMPTHRFYYENFSKKMEDEFNKIIKNLMNEFKFQYFDFFRKLGFDDSDFRDSSHFWHKKNGAIKFSLLLNEVANIK